MSSHVDAIEAIQNLKMHAQAGSNLAVSQYPFDAQILLKSPIYKKSRELFIEMGGSFSPRVLSVPRALSSQDLLSWEIEYSPLEAELLWWAKNSHQVGDAEIYWEQMAALSSSLFHEQNHRIIWPLMPAIPADSVGRSRWFHFVESLVMTLDIVLACDVGGDSVLYENLKLFYRENENFNSSLEAYLVFFWSSYLFLEGYSQDNVEQALADYLNELGIGFAVKKAFELSGEFLVSNREWQRLHLDSYSERLLLLQKKWELPDFQISENPWEFQIEMDFVQYVLEQFMGAK